MTEFAVMLDLSPTEVFTEPSCSFCGTPAGRCRVLVANDLKTAFVCEVCAPIVAAQVRDTLARQDHEAGRAD